MFVNPWCKSFYFSDNFFINEIRKVEDTKGVTRRSRKSKGRQYNGQKKTEKRTNTNLQNITNKTKDRATRTPLKTGVNSGGPEMLAIPAPYMI